MNDEARANRWKSQTSGVTVTAESVSIPRRHRNFAMGSSSAELRGSLDLGGDRGELGASDVERREVVAIRGLGGCLLETLGARPKIDTCHSAPLSAGITPALAEQEGHHAVLSLSTVVPAVVAHAHRVVQRLLNRARHADPGSSPARCRRARLHASMRSVWTRPTARRDAMVGAITSQATPSELSSR